MIPAVSAGSNHDGASDTCTPQVTCPSGFAAAAEPVEQRTPEPAKAADIFRMSRRLGSPTEWVAILAPFRLRLSSPATAVPASDPRRATTTESRLSTQAPILPREHPSRSPFPVAKRAH